MLMLQATNEKFFFIFFYQIIYQNKFLYVNKICAAHFCAFNSYKRHIYNIHTYLKILIIIIVIIQNCLQFKVVWRELWKNNNIK